MVGVGHLVRAEAEEAKKAPFAAAHAIFDGVVKLCPTGFGNVIFAAGYVAVCWLFLLFLHRKNVFLKA